MAAWLCGCVRIGETYGSCVKIYVAYFSEWWQPDSLLKVQLNLFFLEFAKSRKLLFIEFRRHCERPCSCYRGCNFCMSPALNFATLTGSGSLCFPSLWGQLGLWHSALNLLHTLLIVSNSTNTLSARPPKHTQCQPREIAGQVIATEARPQANWLWKFSGTGAGLPLKLLNEMPWSWPIALIPVVY